MDINGAPRFFSSTNLGRIKFRLRRFGLSSERTLRAWPFWLGRSYWITKLLCYFNTLPILVGVAQPFIYDYGSFGNGRDKNNPVEGNPCFLCLSPPSRFLPCQCKAGVAPHGFSPSSFSPTLGAADERVETLLHPSPLSPSTHP